MKSMIGKFSLVAIIFGLVSICAFALILFADMGLLSFDTTWGLWYVGLFSGLTAVLATAGWGTCCGMQHWRERHQLDMKPSP